MISIYSTPLRGRKRIPVSILILATFSFLITSCSTSVEMIAGRLQGRVEILEPLYPYSNTKNPLDFDNAIVKIVPTSDRGVVMALRGENYAHLLSRYDSLLNRVWVTSIPRLFNNERCSFLFQTGELIALVSYEISDSAAYLLRRMYNAVNGTAVGDVVVDTIALKRHARSETSCQVFCSPDSSKLLISVWHAARSIWTGKLDDDEAQILDNTVIDSKSMKTINHVVWRVDGRERITARQIDNDANTYTVTLTDKDTVIGAMYQASGDKEFHLLRTSIPDRDDDFVARATLASVPSTGRLNVAVSVYDGWGGELACVGTVQFDFTTGKSLADLIYLPPLMEKLIDDDECDNCHIVGLYPTVEAKGSLVILERRWIRSGGINVGDVVLLHLDSAMKLRWSQGIVKEDSKNAVGFVYLALVAHVIESRVLRIVYMADPELILREYRIADGTELTPTEGVRLADCDNATYVRSYTTTTVDHDLVFMLLHGPFNSTSMVYKVSP